eukprot:gene29914-655_t
MLLFLAVTAVSSNNPITYKELQGKDTGPGSSLRWKQCSVEGFRCACCNEHAKPPYTSECASQNTTCPASALAAACSKIPHCSGFNSNGWLKSCVTAACGQHIEDNPSVNTYFGSSTAPGPWPPTPPQPSPSPSPPPPSPYTPPPPPPSKPPAPPSRPLSPPSPVPNVDDFHFPHEEAAEMAAAA